MSERTPRVSLGLPVYNGERFLAACIESLLSQSFGDFELIVSDNASQDGTPDIAASYAARDGRVRLVRQEVNRGAAWNFNNACRLATGDHFKWVAHDDLCAPAFLERAVAVLDRDPSVVLCHAAWARIDEAGAIQEFEEPGADYDPPAAPDRFRNLIRMDQRRHTGVEIFGLMRRDALRRVNQPPLGPFAHGDRLTLAALTLFGRFHKVPEVLLLNRSHKGRSMLFDPRRTWRGRTRMGRLLGIGPIPPDEWFDPVWKDRIAFPEWRLLREYWRAIDPAPLTAAERLQCRLHVGAWAMGRAPKLGRDLLIAGEQALARVRGTAGAPCPAPLPPAGPPMGPS
ncbi:glycosyltransferase family 2 protein [Azospirillum sp. RWY-5-1]|uniref:Glycosyltransferase family 2 protein n=1 Tax=Azospirillum oleiclasticum TaxID=2735135 RepID=A0ABX2TKE3_9PROT|nr:glycosyltransferase family 2 protein [Azospirillum oleiclasticum]NYZ15967.1 glycosyltransferase family 2 protein [Azospirillum oleiclasticum]NYZ23554.1 glycosyltransferase family 2 protein [Azospirillum oleiclasticum]